MESIGYLNGLSLEQRLLGFWGLWAILAGILSPFVLLGVFSSFYRQRLQYLRGMRPFKKAELSSLWTCDPSRTQVGR